MFVLKVKRVHKQAQLPLQASSLAAGLDLSSVEEVTLQPQARALISTGLSCSFPHGYVMFIKDRSGLAAKHGLTVLAGVIDADYRGEVKVVLHNTSSEPYTVKVGDRIAQAVFLPIPEVTIQEVDELDETARGSGSFGSSGK